MRELYECVERVSTIADFGGIDSGPTLAWAQSPNAPSHPRQEPWGPGDRFAF